MVLEEKSEGNRPLGRHRYRWKDTIKVVLKDLDWDGMEWIYLAHDRDNWWAVVNAVMKLGVP
jgi:hypothetical protein